MVANLRGLRIRVNVLSLVYGAEAPFIDPWAGGRLPVLFGELTGGVVRCNEGLGAQARWLAMALRG